MNILTLLRTSSNTDSTLGELFWESEGVPSWLAYTLEDEHRNVKVDGETRIPQGFYRLKLRTEGGMYSRNRELYHKGMIWLQDVPGFEWIYLHPGLTDDHTDGCILTADGIASQNVTKAGRLQNSRECWLRIYPRIANGIADGSLTGIRIIDYA